MTQKNRGGGGVQGSAEAGQKSIVLRVDQEEQQFVFTDVTSQPVPSLLRNFSAPVKMEVKGQTDDDLIFLLAHDTGTPCCCCFSVHKRLSCCCWLGCASWHSASVLGPALRLH